MTEEMLYANYFNVTAPVKTFLKRREAPLPVTCAQNSAEWSVVQTPPEAYNDIALRSYLTPAEVALLLKVNVRTVLRKLEDKSLKGKKTGRFWRIEKADLESYVQNFELIKLK